MRSVRRLAVLILAGGLAACAAPVAITPVTLANASERPVEVVVERDGDRWTAEFILDRDAPVWAFTRSALVQRTHQPWRPEQWTVETPGVVLERQGSRDVLRAADGGPVPRRVRVAIRPASVDLEADYDPALLFTDGSVALYTAQFDVIPLQSREAARALPHDLNGVELAGGPARVTWRDRAGPVLFRGERRAEAVAWDANTYVLFGQAGLVEGGRWATVIDPALPTWIGTELRAFTPRVTDFYAGRLGPGGADTYTVMVSWDGPTPRRTSMGGSVLPGLVVMTFEGEGVVRPSEEILSRARWFIGHESAHFWLGETVHYERASDAWITEGGADLMAIRALEAMDPAYDERAGLQKAVDDCLALSRGRSVASAAERGEHRAYYACGAVFALAAEGAVRRVGGRDWFDFLRPLVEANRKDGILTRAEWLAELTRVSGDSTLARDMTRLLDEGSADPAAIVAALFQRTGVPHRLEDGTVRLL
ncbi:hypothetical protein KYC5002_28255 [Archangium violaceum]|uniref:hypothetical protein n=1 Tax=Archangium violaceum TaxID=83451 RepID=UPI002B2EC664|nr:hypothetical protein KYC5002_28255 [Archangium gephyra]